MCRLSPKTNYPDMKQNNRPYWAFGFLEFKCHPCIANKRNERVVIAQHSDGLCIVDSFLSNWLQQRRLMFLFVKHFVHINSCVLGVSLLSSFLVLAIHVSISKCGSLGNAFSPTERLTLLRSFYVCSKNCKNIRIFSLNSFCQPDFSLLDHFWQSYQHEHACAIPATVTLNQNFKGLLKSNVRISSREVCSLSIDIHIYVFLFLF